MIEKVNTRRAIQLWVREQLIDEERANVPELSRAAIEHFMEDHGFVASFLEDNIYFVIREIAKRELGRGRKSRVFEFDGGDTYVTEECFNKEVASQSNSIFEDWWTHTSQGYVRLTNMNRELVREARLERLRGIRGDLVHIRFYELIEQRMENDLEEVRDRFGEEELRKMLRKAEDETKEAEGA